MINGNGKEIFKKLYEYNRAYLKYQKELINKYGVFYCGECEEIHELSKIKKGSYLCEEKFKEKEKQRVREYRRKKKEALGK